MRGEAHNRLDLVGRQFGRFAVVGLADGRGPHGEMLWRCLCACGAEMVRNTNKLRTGHSKSCGCLKRRCGADSPNADIRPILDRLAEQSHYDLKTGCLIWNGLRAPFGHGTISVLGRGVRVHRAAWVEQRGPIPDDIDCLHNCPGGDNPACWNVEHLWLGTQGDNNADRDRKGRHVPLPGMEHGCARLTDDQIIAIRADTRSYREIADAYGMAEAHIGSIIRGDAWKHLPGSSQGRRRPTNTGPKLTEAIVRAIRSDSRSQEAVARDVGVSVSLISQVRRRVVWRHVL